MTRRKWSSKQNECFERNRSAEWLFNLLKPTGYVMHHQF